MTDTRATAPDAEEVKRIKLTSAHELRREEDGWAVFDAHGRVRRLMGHEELLVDAALAAPETALKAAPVAEFGWFYEMDSKDNPKAGPVYLGGDDRKTVQVVADDEGKVAFPLYASPMSAPAGWIDNLRGLDTDKRVRFYEHDFYVLSNFSAFTLVWKGIRFDTSEAAYHFEKFSDGDGALADVRAIQWSIRTAPSAHEAFKIAERNRAHRRPDWDDVKVGIMRDILRAKAEQHEYVRRKLLATGDRELVEDSWRDDFWGWGPSRDGKNMLGKLWMEIRASLRVGADALEPANDMYLEPLKPVAWHVVAHSSAKDRVFFDEVVARQYLRDHDEGDWHIEALCRVNESAWWSLVMGAAASLEDAANCLRDPDAKRAAEGAARHYREKAKALAAQPLRQEGAEPTAQPASVNQQLVEALRIFVRCATPVSTDIDERGRTWSEAYLDEARETALAALAAAEGAKT